MSHSEGLKIALKLIAEEAKAKTGKLDLGQLGLSEIPKEIGSLTHLRELLIGYTWIDNKRTGHDIAKNTISDFSPLSDLQNLNSLNCNHTQLSDLSPLSNIKSLNSLDCSYTQVSDLSPLVATKL
jgi:internalin A